MRLSTEDYTGVDVFCTRHLFNALVKIKFCTPRAESNFSCNFRVNERLHISRLSGARSLGYLGERLGQHAKA